jgi:hypothetical protein
MNALIRKEIRLVLPLWSVAMLLVLVATWLIAARHPSEPSSITNAAQVATVFGALMLGLAPFGLEFSAGTFQQFLSQPIARKRLWWLKAGIQGLAAALVLLCGLLCAYGLGPDYDSPMEFFASSGCLSLAAVAGGLWTTLLFRQIAAALWFAVLVPVVIAAATTALIEKLLQPPVDSHLPDYCGYAAVFLYSVAAFFWARRMFLRAQDTLWTGGTVSLPNWFGARKQAVAAQFGRRPLRALCGKELPAQHVSLLLAAFLVVLHVAAIGLRKAEFIQSPTTKMLPQVLGFWWCLWFAMPLLIGSAAVAEERKHGTLESQLCLPVTRRFQFSTKLGFALVLGILLGGVMPWLLESLGAELGFRGDFPAIGKPSSWPALLFFCVGGLGITFVSFYASTLTRNLLQAMGAALVTAMVLAGFMGWALTGGPLKGGNLYLWFGPLAGWIGLPIIVLAILVLSFRNYGSLYVGGNTWWRNSLALVASMAVIVLSTMVIYNRAWEWFMPLEPPHGPAQLSGSVRPQICSVGRKFGMMPDGTYALARRVFVLLPDGRVWVATHHRFKRSGEKVSVGSSREHTQRDVPFSLPIPVAGTWVGGANWVQLASDWDHVFGIQSDGSLWKLFTATRTNAVENLSTAPIPERIGTDTDWKSVVAGYAHFLMLKNDGTLWGWGRNDSGQLGPGPTQFTNELVKVGHDADWASVFASRATSVGVKRDGSVWKWGELPISPSGNNYPSWKQSPRPEPVQWGLQGKDWREWISLWGCDFILKDEGSLWAWGYVQPDLLGNHLFEANGGNRFCAQPLRIGDASDWTAIACDFTTLVGLKRTGRIVQFELNGPRLVCWRGVWWPSRYSDWLSIDSNSWLSPCLALARDGTLSSWQSRNAWQELEARRLLGPSRKPLWTVNILGKR